MSAHEDASGRLQCNVVFVEVLPPELQQVASGFAEVAAESGDRLETALLAGSADDPAKRPTPRFGHPDMTTATGSAMRSLPRLWPETKPHKETNGWVCLGGGSL